jgi:hypothetical protein
VSGLSSRPAACAARPAIIQLTRRSYYTSESFGSLHLFLGEMKPTICPMKIREAKDFLVQQIVEQAQRENVPLSDLEKRMMYFSEGTNAVEDPASLNEAFEKQHDTTKYEKKISLLMRQVRIPANVSRK